MNSIHDNYLEDIMIKGIGVDMVDIRDIKKYLKNPSFEKHTFTDLEQQEAKKRANLAEYYATRFAAKEAVFKSIAYLTKTKGFDLRIVETLNREDGSPQVIINEKLNAIMKETGVKKLHISITTETDYAIAFVIAEG